MSRRLSILAALAMLALVAMLAGCDSSSPRPASADLAPPEIPRIVRQSDGTEILQLDAATIPGATVEPVKQLDLPSVLEANGQVGFEDRRVSTIVSRVSGRIDRVRVSQWDDVHRGEPIVALYSPDFMTAEAEYLQAADTSRLSDAPGIGAPFGLANSLRAAAERKLELLGMERSDIAAITAPSPTVWMRAPMGGTIVESHAVTGAAIAPGDVLFSLGDLSEVWINIDIYQDDLARVHEGQKVEAVTTAFPDEVFQGEISRLSPGIDPTTHTAQIRCAVANPGLKLRPQMLVRVRIVTPRGTALFVPQRALVFETDAYYAFVPVGAKGIERRKVAIASWSRTGNTRILSGLNPGDSVVVDGALQVDELWREAPNPGHASSDD